VNLRVMTPLNFDFAPWRLSGQVFGVLLNHRPRWRRWATR
jgi:hypothetical protein